MLSARLPALIATRSQKVKHPSVADERVEKAGEHPIYSTRDRLKDYVVERGLMTTTEAGTMFPVPVYVQPRSLPPAETGTQAGKLGAICCESVGGVDEVTLVG